MKNSKLPGSLSAFFEYAPKGVPEILQILSAAACLTDDLGRHLMAGRIPDGMDHERILDCIHNSDLIIESEKEWAFDPSIRKFLLAQLNQDPELAKQVHESLLAISLRPEGGMILPDYIIQPVGRAYHTAVFDHQKALRLFMEAFNAGQPGECWFIGALAGEQQELGYLPEEAIEPSFLQGMSAYRASRWDEATAHLRCVVDRDDSRKETAVALYTLALMTSSRNPTEATRLMERCLLILEKNGSPDEIRHARQILSSISGSTGADLEQLIQRVLFEEGLQSFVRRMMAFFPQNVLFQALSTNIAVAAGTWWKPQAEYGARTNLKPSVLRPTPTPEEGSAPEPRDIAFDCLKDIGIKIARRKLHNAYGKRIAFGNFRLPFNF